MRWSKRSLTWTIRGQVPPLSNSIGAPRCAGRWGNRKKLPLPTTCRRWYRLGKLCPRAGAIGESRHKVAGLSESASYGTKGSGASVDRLSEGAVPALVAKPAISSWNCRATAMKSCSRFTNACTTSGSNCVPLPSKMIRAPSDARRPACKRACSSRHRKRRPGPRSDHTRESVRL